MEYAQKALETKKVYEVAELLNYTSIHNFSRAYKKYFGFNPSAKPDA